jgi:hypothetical protein
MRNKILQSIPFAEDRHTFYDVNYLEIHLVDWKDTDRKKGRAKRRGIEVFDNKQEEIKSVCLSNTRRIAITIDAFGENALEVNVGNYASQCECIVAPTTFSSDNWILAIETKYAEDHKTAFQNNEITGIPDYPQEMVKQIISTVDYLRNKGVIGMDQTVHAIVSFPNLIADFNSELFSWVKDEWSKENLLLNKKIRISGCNAANIISSKRIKHRMN